MLQQLVIENFLRVPFIDLKPNAPVVLIAGHNEQGKSSIAEAVRFAFLDDNQRIKYKRDRGQLIHNGATKGSVTIQWDNNTVRRNVKDGKPTGDSQCLPDDTCVAQICLQATRFATMPDEQRRTLVMRLANVDLSVDKVAERLKAKGVDAETIRKYRPLLKNGVQAAHDHVKRATSDARGAWKEITGEVYGSEKAVTWAPVEPIMPAAEAGTALVEIDTSIAAARAARDNELSPVLMNISQYETQLRRPDPLACPHCGGAVLMAGGELEKYENASDKGKLRTKLNLAQMKRKQIADEHDNKISALLDDQRTLQEQIAASENAIMRTNRAKALHEEVQASDRLTKLLSEGPDGVAAELISESLKPLNDRLLEIGQAISWTPVALMGDMSVRRIDGYGYALLSESAQWRADAMLHVLVSELAGFSWLIFDRLDVLAPGDRPQFMAWLNEYAAERADELSVLVMATLKGPPNLSGLPAIDIYWIDGGSLSQTGR
jgi:DNA repair exonuclease SbcCD ATPase subunit